MQYDLITCVHGLHYVGDKLGVLEKAMACLTDDGVFIANLDIKSIRIVSGDSYLKNFFAMNGIKYSARTRIIECRGRRNIHFNVSYTGAKDDAGPNYTGQDGVDSYYSMG
jgi:hypothetical protein